MDQLDNKSIFKDLLGQLDNPELQARKDFLVLKAKQVKWVSQARLDSQVQRVHQVPQARKVLLANKVLQVRLEPQDHKVPQDRQETLGHRVLRGHRGVACGHKLDQIFGIVAVRLESGLLIQWETFT